MIVWRTILGLIMASKWPARAQVGDFRITRMASWSYRGADGRSNRAYVQGFHSGIIEAVIHHFSWAKVPGKAPSASPPCA
jgi:hypothetical protein